MFVVSFFSISKFIIAVVDKEKASPLMIALRVVLYVKKSERETWSTLQG